MSSLPPRRIFGLQLAIVARRWRTTVDAALATDNLTEAAWGPLVHLSRLGDGVQQKVLAARIGIDTSTLVRLIDMLENRQLVLRQVDPHDRRGRLVHLTDDGRAQVARIEETLARAEGHMLADIDDADLDQLLTSLQKIQHRIQEHVAETQ